MLEEHVIVGNVGRDPELRYTNAGRAVLNFSVATNRTWRDEAGEKQQDTTWYRVAVWGSYAETLHQYLEKGQQVLVVADRLKANAYIAKDGKARASLEVMARTVKMLGRRSNGGGYAPEDVWDEPQDAVDDIPF